MRPLHNQIIAKAGGLGVSLNQRPTLVAPVFYFHGGEPALVATTPAALPSSMQGRKGGLHWQAAKESLARFLAEHLLERQLPDLALGRNPLGKPQIRLGAAPGPALSFSWCAGLMWAAVGRSENGLGLDAAAPSEFTGPYPHQRVFRDTEWQAAVNLLAGNREEAAALLWSVKEAVVKAGGCGFHFLSPRRVEVQFASLGDQGYLWHGYLEISDSNGNLTKGRQPVPAVSVRLSEVWLSVAWGR